MKQKQKPVYVPTTPTLHGPTVQNLFTKWMKNNANPERRISSWMKQKQKPAYMFQPPPTPTAWTNHTERAANSQISVILR